MGHASGCRRLLAAAVAAVALAAGAWPSLASADDAEAFKAAYEAAEAARKAAAKVGFEWRDTRRMILLAKKLAEEGKYARAIRLANRAKRQGELGVMQAREQETAWRAAVVK